MIPLTLTDDIQRTLLDYLTTTFNFQDDCGGEFGHPPDFQSLRSDMENLFGSALRGKPLNNDETDK
jgi:hypothetical protein